MKTAYMEGCGNSFFVMNSPQKEMDLPEITRAYHSLNGTRSVDAVLVLGPSVKGDIRMLYFDVDRRTKRLHRASMCGNGIRCISRFARDQNYAGDEISVETDNGLKGVSIVDSLVTVDMGQPRNYMRFSDSDYYVDVGLPHYVRFVDRLDAGMIREVGKVLRDDDELLGRIGNPNDILHFNGVSVTGESKISIMTREGGVEDITLACGTGSVASAFVSHEARGLQYPITVHNAGGDLVINRKGDNMIMTGPANYMD